ncbi:MAG: hypothetical protein L0I24_14985, partial [Pseudonocardia sp.]|nr:hypothetical protein [Pseudonocardia sp.]
MSLLPIATAGRTRRSVTALVRPHRLLFAATVLTLVAAAVAVLAVPPLLGAIVTDSGGLLSHAAIVAREYG